jgi:hypothetical protein
MWLVSYSTFVVKILGTAISISTTLTLLYRLLVGAEGAVSLVEDSALHHWQQPSLQHELCKSFNTFGDHMFFLGLLQLVESNVIIFV